MANNELLEKYAGLVVDLGINIQQKQTLVITSPIEGASFARTLARIAYQRGAREVVVHWRDELLDKVRLLHAPEEVLAEFPNWRRELYMSYMKQGAAFLYVVASDPELLKEVDPKRIVIQQKAQNLALKEYRESMMCNKNAWTIISIPTESWAKKVFPYLTEPAAVQQLWKAIFKTVRVDTPDPIAAWNEHKNDLKKRTDFLNSHSFKYLYFKNSLGTDLKIELPAQHLWVGCLEHTSETGIGFIANMPTEEVYTLPSKTGVNGTVVSSKPLIYNGNVIEDFTITFEVGKIVAFKASRGYEILKDLIETDEGSCYLGEVALVPYASPISQKNILFYNTLFDENASCHLAIGKAYPTCLKGGDEMEKIELSANGVNDSMVHVDFMIGTADLELIGITAENKEVHIMKKGNFVEL